MSDDAKIAAIRSIVYDLLQRRYSWNGDVTLTMDRIFNSNEYQIDGFLYAVQVYLSQQGYIFDYDMTTFIPHSWTDTPPDVIVDIDARTKPGGSHPQLVPNAQKDVS